MLELQDFYVEPATWAVDRDDLAAVRTEVFIVEQQVPEDEEFDDDDPASDHFIARDLSGRPIGTARLTADGRIGRMAVLTEQRGKGIGDALLRNAVERARLKGLSQVRLAAQEHAIPFYRRHGFEAEGETFDEVGIPHRWMQLDLAPAEVGHVERRRREVDGLDGRDTRAIESREDYRDGLLDLIAACRHELVLFTRDLEPTVLGEDRIVEAIRQLATTSPQPAIRIMLSDSTRAIKDGHRLIPLAQRLTSVIQFRLPAKQHRDRLSVFAVADRDHVLDREFGDRWEGTLHPNDRHLARRLLEWFDEAWEQGHRDPNLERLDL